MKFLFVLLSFTVNLAAANSNSEIVCMRFKNNASFSIDTKTKEVFYNDFNNDYAPVQDAVFSGINSTKNYEGEILGEIELYHTAYFVTLIMRKISGNAQLEARFYPKNKKDQVIRQVYNNCFYQQEHQ